MKAAVRKKDCYDEIHYGRVDTVEALRILVANCLLAQEHLPKRSREASADYLEDYCTVRMKCARTMGHTTAMFQVARMLFKRPLLLFPTSDMARLNRNRNGWSQDTCRSFHHLGKMTHALADAIFVDCASSLKDGHLREIRLLAAPLLSVNGKFCLVYLQ